MTKYFCDGCGDEITERNESRGGHNIESRLGTTVQKGGIKLKVEIFTHEENCANAGLFCKYCILDALYQLDDRPKAAPKTD